MHTIRGVIDFLDQLAPPALAEAWDNVGLLVGDAGQSVERVMTCLTITEASADEAIAEGAQLIVTHHPLPFHATKRITTESPSGKLLWRLIGARVAIYSAHTAFDSAARGINDRLASGLGLVDARPLVASTAGGLDSGALGSGRHGKLPRASTLALLAEQVKGFLKLERVQCVGKVDRPIARVAVACGSGGDFLAAAHAAGCDALVTGEARFHTALEAESLGMALVLAGHFASERFGVVGLAAELARKFADLRVWASRAECDPLFWF